MIPSSSPMATAAASLLLLPLVLLLAPMAVGAVSDDVLTLVVFKSGVSDPSGRLVPWSEDADRACAWLGVSCDPRTGHVAALALPAASLSGRVPRSGLRAPPPQCPPLALPPRDTEGNAVVTPEEMRNIIEVIADSGKFWHDWSFLKRLLSLHLKQVLAEYSDAQMVSREGGQQQNSLSGETYSELISRLNNAFLRFEEGPPFTLQRLCEILLDPKGTYTKLSKLALALEKNLLVTSTMIKCTDPYPGAHGPNSEGTAITENTGAVDVEPEMLPEHPAVVPNGTEHVGGDGDEEMADAEAEVSGSRDVEMREDKPDRISNVNSDANSGAAVTSETVNVSEKSSDPQS